MNKESQPPTSLEQLDTAWEVQERPFTSSTPLIGPLLAWFRTAWNNVATRWYVRPIIQQQNEFNQLTVQQFRQVQRNFQEASSRFADLDGRLVAQDHDHAALTHDVGELAAQLVQLNRQLQSLNERLAAMEQANRPDGKRD